MKSRVNMAQSNLGRQLMTRIREDGYTCMGLMPDAGKPGWTYTIGFCTFRLPELVIPDLPGPKAREYLELFAGGFYRHKRVPVDGSRVTMPDGTVWTVQESSPKASEYGTPWALRLFGDRFRVRCVKLLPPRDLAWPKFSPWPGSECTCGACTPPSPLEKMQGQVGTRHLSIG